MNLKLHQTRVILGYLGSDPKYHGDAFRETCIDYLECNKALNYWSSLASREALMRQKEYSDLLEELEQEMLQAVLLQYSENNIAL